MLKITQEQEQIPHIEELGWDISLDAAIFVVLGSILCLPFFILYSLCWIFKKH